MITDIAHLVSPIDLSQVLSKTSLATEHEDQKHCGYPKDHSEAEHLEDKDVRCAYQFQNEDRSHHQDRKLDQP